MIEVKNRKHTASGHYVGRPMGERFCGSALGNPFKVDKAIPGNREKSLQNYDRWLRAQWRNNGPARKELEHLAQIYAHRGRLTLLCWCAPEPCHADIVKKAIEGIHVRNLINKDIKKSLEETND